MSAEMPKDRIPFCGILIAAGSVERHLSSLKFSEQQQETVDYLIWLYLHFREVTTVAVIAAILILILTCQIRLEIGVARQLGMMIYGTFAVDLILFSFAVLCQLIHITPQCEMSIKKICLKKLLSFHPFQEYIVYFLI